MDEKKEPKVGAVPVPFKEGLRQNAKIILPDELQKEMFKFFLETSIPRKKKELEDKNRILSENQKTDRSDKNVNENRDIC